MSNNRLIEFFLAAIDIDKSIIHKTDVYVRLSLIDHTYICQFTRTHDIVIVFFRHDWTPLMCACASNSSSTCTLLLAHGANISMTNDRNQNVFHFAAFLGSVSIVNELIRTSTNNEILVQALNQVDDRQQTPLFCACIEGHLEIVVIYLNAGADPYRIDRQQQTCLHAMLSSSVIFGRHIRLVYSLLDMIDYRVYRDCFGRTLLDLAEFSQLSSIRHLLIYLRYPRSYEIESNNRRQTFDEIPRSVLSLRQVTVLTFKRSIIAISSRSHRSTMRDLLDKAIQQCFQLSTYDGDTISDCMPLNDSLSVDGSQLPSSCSSETSQSKAIVPSHPMKLMAYALLKSTARFDDLVDFPSYKRNSHLIQDLDTIMRQYHLQRAD
jgi:hypothetical protein